MEEVIGILLYLDLTSDPKQKIFFPLELWLLEMGLKDSSGKPVAISQDIMVKAGRQSEYKSQTLAGGEPNSRVFERTEELALL